MLGEAGGFADFAFVAQAQNGSHALGVELWRDAILGLLILFAIATDAVILSRLRAWWAHNPMRARA